MDAKFKPRWSRIEKTVNDILVAANGCLAVVAILLASLIFIELQISSWQVDNAGKGALSTVELRFNPPPPFVARSLP